MDCNNCLYFFEDCKTFSDCKIYLEFINQGNVKPYCDKDYETAKKQGLNLDDWGDYKLYFEL